MTVLVVDSDWAALREIADKVTRQNVPVSLVLKNSLKTAEQFSMYHPVDFVFVRFGLPCGELFRKVNRCQPMAECHVLGEDDDLLSFLLPYAL